MQGRVGFEQLVNYSRGDVNINPNQADVDLIVESQGNSNLIRTDAANNEVGIGTAPTSGAGVLQVDGNTKIGTLTIEEDSQAQLHVVGTTASLTVERHDDGSAAGPTLNLYRHSDSPADNDEVGQISFRGEDDTNNNATYASIKAVVKDVSATSKDGQLTIRTLTANSQTDAIIIDDKVNSEITHNFKGEIQLNDQAGTAGQVLTSQGSGADPIWAAGGGGGSSFPQIATTPTGGYYIPFCLPPLSYNVLSFSSTTLSDDLLFSPVLFTSDTTITEMGTRYGGGTLNPFSMCIYESDSDYMPDTKLAGSEIAFASPGTSFNIATLTSPLTLSANTFYWVGFTNTTNGSNVSITSVAAAGSPVTTDGSDFNRSSVGIYSGTINSLPATVTTSDLKPLYSCPWVFFK